MKIPRIIHQIWLGPNPLPESDAVFVETWKRLHPDWEHRLWTEENIPDGVRPEVRDRLRVPAERSDLLRLEVVVRFGGVYADTDFEALKPLDPLLEDVELFAAYLRDDFEDGSDLPARINNAIFGAVPNHPVLVRAVEQAQPRASYGYDKNAVGPMFLDRMLQGTDAVLFDRTLFYPRPLEREGAVAYHHQARTWKDAAGMQRSLRVAGRRRKAMRFELRELQRRKALREQPSSPSARAAWQAFVAERFARRVDRKLRWELGKVRAAIAARTGPQAELLRARAEGALGRRPEVAVPRTIHHIWLDGPVPAEVERRRTAWSLANPGWTLRLWTADDLAHADVRPEVAQPLRAPAERIDLLRLDILRREGGVVVDARLGAHRLAQVAGSATCFAIADRRGEPATAVIGATPGHPAIDAVIAEQHPREWWGYDPAATGVGALVRAIAGGAAVELVSGLEHAVLDDEAATRAALRARVLADEDEVAALEQKLARLRTELGASSG